MLDINRIRSDFPILRETVYDRPLVYLDNAATTQKPRQVLSVLQKQYARYNGNVHRSSHYLSNQSTLRFEQARADIAAFLHAGKSEEIIFTKGATEGINLVCESFGDKYIREGDAVIVSEMEHHSNLVPWIMLCRRKGARLRVVPFDDSGNLDLDEYSRLIDEKVKLVALTHVSNVLGTVNPVGSMIRQAHAKGIPVLIDGAQAVAHQEVDVQALDCDFYCFSGHKMFAPTGIGVLYGKEQRLNQLSPYQFGGEMIDRVTISDVTFEKIPYRFEAGTPNYAGTIALGAAVKYIQAIGMDNIQQYEQMLLEYAQEKLESIGGVRILGTPNHRAGTISFLLDGVHSYDLALMLDKLGIAIRAGNHCAQPVLKHFGAQSAARISLACYNTMREIDGLCDSIIRIGKLFGMPV